MIIATHAIIIILQTITRHVSYMPRPNMQIFNYTYMDINKLNYMIIP